MELGELKFISINKPLLGEEEKKAVLEVLDSGILTDAGFQGGPTVRKFEAKVASLLGTKHVIAVNSGTAALHASLMACGVGEGDEVILPSFTFVATANVIRALRAKPVFADIKEDYNIDPDSAKRAISKRTKAIIPVHLYGYPADMDEITELADKHSLSVVEDAAESLGAEYRGRQTGSMSRAGCFSLYATKVVTSGEGGAVSTNDDEVAEKLRMIRSHGMVEGHDTRVLGFNLRMGEIQAAIASVQMGKLRQFIQQRKKNATTLTENIASFEQLKPTQVSSDRTHVWYLYTLHVERNRDRVEEFLRKNKIGASVYWKMPVHKTPYYSDEYSRTALPRTDDAAGHVLSIPVHPAITDFELEHIVRELKRAAMEYLRN